MDFSGYSKFEIVRKGNSSESVCPVQTLLGLITDTELAIPGVPVMKLTDWGKLLTFLLIINLGGLE